MKWIKLTKHFQGGVHSNYMLVEDSKIETEYQQQELMENWGEDTHGGHNYGYHVEIHILDENEKPPREWLENAIVSGERNIKYLEKLIEKEKDLIDYYKNNLHELLP